MSADLQRPAMFSTRASGSSRPATAFVPCREPATGGEGANGDYMNEGG